MTRLSRHPCAHPGCGELVDAGQSRCGKHRRKAEKADREKRGSARSRGYGRRWEAMRLVFLREHPLCAIHLAKGETVAANVVDHIIPHKGDQTLFNDPTNLQALCKTCHDEKTAVEDGGFGRGGMRPMLHRPFVVPVCVVCGPAGSGKSSMVRAAAAVNDLVVDLDDILEEVSGLPRYQAGEDWIAPALRVRNTRIRRLCDESPHRMGWLIATAPKRADREHWRKAGAHVVLVSTPFGECLRRIRGDAPNTKREQWARDWFDRFEASTDDRWVRDADELRAVAARLLAPPTNRA